MFAATFGGGLVDGDAIALRAHLHEGAEALLGTQASTKVYKGRCGQSLTATVADGGRRVVVPPPR